MGGGIAIGLEEALFLARGGLDLVEGGEEAALGAFGVEGGGFFGTAGLAGDGGLAAGFGGEGAEGGVEGGGEAAFFEVGGVAVFTSEGVEVFAEFDVVELGLVEEAGGLGVIVGRVSVGGRCVVWHGGRRFGSGGGELKIFRQLAMRRLGYGLALSRF